MGYKRYTAQYKTRIVLEVLQGEKEIGEIAAENNMVRNWKREFLENASAAFESLQASQRKRQRRKRKPSVRKLLRCLKPLVS